jgi:hypothetical protein
VQETDYYGKKLSPICAKNDGSFVTKKDDGSTEMPAYVFCFETLMYPGNWDISGENNFQLSNIHDLVLIRFADVLLMQSELKEDVTGINKVRARAGLAPLAAYSLKALQNERRWEFATEGIRWNDIRRWHIAATAPGQARGTEHLLQWQSTTNTPHNVVMPPATMPLPVSRRCLRHRLPWDRWCKTMAGPMPVLNTLVGNRLG